MPRAIRSPPFSCDASAERNGTKLNQNTQVLGQARVPRLLVQLAIPAVVAQVINLLYNIVDRIYIGHIPEIGADALTGAGLFMPILMLINAFALLFRKKTRACGRQFAFLFGRRKLHKQAGRDTRNNRAALCVPGSSR